MPGLNEWLFGIFGTAFGVILGNWLAIGRDKRKERNEARSPIWIALRDDNQRSGIPTSPSFTGIQEVALYRDKVCWLEWRRYQHHAQEFERLRAQEEYARDIERHRMRGANVETLPPPHELTDKERKRMNKHKEMLIHLTRQR